MWTYNKSLSSRESKALAKKLRHEDPEQFQTLVRMHLSFFLDLTMEEIAGLPEKNKFRPLKWGLAPFTKKIRGPEKDNTVDNVPLKTDIVKQINYLVDYLSAEENICEEGIFRRSGKLTRQQELKGLLQRGILPKLKDSKYSVHDVASVLKAFLAELPEPLLTEVYYPAYCQIAELCQNEKGTRCRILKALQLLLLLLPIENRMVLKRIVHILHLTASNAENNRMSAQNLATLFTPHLLCPRKLSPEAFHMTAQNLSCIVVFIINQANEIFDVPQTLATDIKAYWDRRRLTPNHLLERSISESTAANTVFTFCDRERSAQENVVNPTETALAQLYAHIQSLPESNKKKRLIKQFNKENGQGTPRTKSIGNSIKKHIFCKNAKARGYLEYQQLRAAGCAGDEVLNSPLDKKTPVRRYNLRVKFENNEKISSVSGFKRMPTTDGESEESEESPPKMAREEPAPGGHDNSSEQEAGSCALWFQSLSVGSQRLECQGGSVVAGTESEDGDGRKQREPRVPDISVPRLPILKVSPDDKPSRLELFQPAGRFRPIFVRRGAAADRLTPLLPRRRVPSVIDSTFWDPPVRV
ncbi:rho GTPase-activating protein 19 isoform X2 [Halyomorpha halys]|uniref:rho GTPase-activating protein 19 isoform X2 n=1 Tax=Halyomorpha halys TaxID=286706 RepID=UPI000D0C8B28|nr:rho GTPase-activating protein 19 isoform X2 [Halyomorpha halys]